MSQNMATRMETAEKRARIVELAKDGLTYDAIARDEQVQLGSRQAVAYHLKAWFEETRPDAEAAEELRLMQWSRLEDLVATLRPHSLMVARSAFGEPILDAEGREQLVPNLPVVERLLKVFERESRLMGLDLQQGVGVAVVTAEALASLLGYDPMEGVVEGEAVEVPVGELEAGGDE